MGFKIENISEINSLISSMSSAVDEIETVSVNAVTALSDLIQNISGENVGEALTKLNSVIASFNNNMLSSERQVNAFINSQISSYAANEEQVVSELESISSYFEGINNE